MAFEIEIKARIKEFATIKERLSAYGKYLHEFEKCDEYWNFEDGNLYTRVRVRREVKIYKNNTEETTLVTCKNKEIVSGKTPGALAPIKFNLSSRGPQARIEVNNEREFMVSDAGVFEEFLKSLGMKSVIKKEKRGYAWQIPTDRQIPIIAELSQVKRLGWFLELEILADNRDDNTIAASQDRFYNLLNALGIPLDKIEERPYTLMLQEAGDG
jgi:adenylate cyclase class IV